MFRSARAEAVAGELLVRKLYEEHGRAALAYATRLTGDRAAAEAVVEETLVRAWRYSDAIGQGGDWVRGWLLSTVENVVLERSCARSAPPAADRGAPRPAAGGAPDGHPQGEGQPDERRAHVRGAALGVLTADPVTATSR